MPDPTPPLKDRPTLVVDPNFVDLTPFIPEDLDAALAAIINNPPAAVTLDVGVSQSIGPQYVNTWDDYIGQASVKRQLEVYIEDSLMRMTPLPHTLLASHLPGSGKTTLARLIALKMDTGITMLVPPFSTRTLYDTAMGMGDYGVLFIDEIHKLADNGPAAAENLLHMMEERVLHIDGRVHQLADFTIIGATTDPDRLPEAVIDRFPIKPHFQTYSDDEMLLIAHNFATYFDTQLSDETLTAIALASRATPRVVRELVYAGRALMNATGTCTPTELLAFKDIEPDGTGHQHRAYLLALYRSFGHDLIVNGHLNTEYSAGEASLMTLLRENKTGLARLERFLIERKLIDRTPRGRRLTLQGVKRAQELAARGAPQV